jgi:hypothetical protein
VITGAPVAFLASCKPNGSRSFFRYRISMLTIVAVQTAITADRSAPKKSGKPMHLVAMFQ